MTNKTDMVEIKTALAFAKENYHPELKVYTKQLAVVFDALEAAEARIAELEKEQREHDSQISTMQGKIDLAVAGFRVANAGREKAEARIVEITEQYVERTTALSFAAQRAEKAEEEIAKLKGDAMPVAYVSERNLKLVTSKKCAVKITHEPVMVRPVPLFTHAQPVPVVVLPIKFSTSMYGTKLYEDKDILKMLETAGITVKPADGDGE